MSLSHLQHSDTAAVKDSLPQTPAQGETTVKAQVHKSYNQTIHHLCACQRGVQRLATAVTNRSSRRGPEGIAMLGKHVMLHGFKRSALFWNTCLINPSWNVGII